MSAAEVETALRSAPTPGGPDLARELAKLNRKLDTLGSQVGHLYERTLAIEELKDELVPIVRDGMGALGVELQAIEHEFNSEEVVELLRKVLRNTPTFVRLLDRLESMDGLITEFEPLGKHVVRDLIDRLEELEQRGYFRLMRGALAILDRVSSHATQEDVDRLAENVVTMVDTVKRMTQPDILERTNQALTAIDQARDGEPVRVGLWGLMRATREPEIQEGLGLMLEAMRQLGHQNGASNQPSSPIQTQKE